MTIARKETISDGVEGVYHCVSRCVRRAFLCGKDHLSGRNFDHRKDDCKGRFWEGRFKCQAFPDDAAILSCLAYVDLNPIRAKIAEAPEKSDFTSAQDRIAARQARRKRAEAQKKPSATQKRMIERLHEHESRDAWLCPLQDATDSGKRGLLPLTVDEYLELLDWTGRSIKTGKRGAIPAHLAAILRRLRIDIDRWVETWRASAAGSVGWSAAWRASRRLRSRSAAGGSMASAPAGKRTTRLSIPPLGVKTRVRLGAFELKTLLIGGKGGGTVEADLIERPLADVRRGCRHD